MMRPFFLLFPFLVFHWAWAQGHRPGPANTRVEVSGRVRDAELNVVLPGVAGMMVRLPDSSRYWGFTDARGYFEITVPPGRYRVKLQMMGYADTAWAMHLDGKSSTMFVGNVALAPSPIQLKEATVTASAYKESLEKTEVIVTDELRKGTVSARQLMEKLPGIEYDPFNDAIRVDNKENILLLVNGMEKTPEYIKDLPPDRIKKIEIIRDPTGRYALEGYSAVINIVLRDDYLGTSLSLSTMTAFNFFRQYSPSLLPFQFRRLSATHTRGKWSFYLHGSSWHPNGAMRTSETLTSSEGKMVWEQIPADTLPFNSYFRSAGYRAVVGVDYIPSEGNIGSIELNARGQFRPQTSQREVLVVRGADSLLSSVVASTSSDSRRMTFFTHVEITPENKLTIRLRGERSGSTTDRTIEEGPAVKREEKSYSSVLASRPYIEWQHQFSPAWELLTGYSLNYREDFGTLHSSLLQNDSVVGKRTYDYANTLARHQAYGYLTWRKGKFTVRAGTAVERYQLVTPGGSHAFTMPQPSVDVLWQFHRILSLRMKYRSELNYPSANQLADLRSATAPGIFSEGNPKLLPYNVHYGSIQLGAMGGRARIEPYVKYSGNRIANRLLIRGDSIIIRPENVGQYWRKGVELSFPLPLGKRLFMMVSGDIYSEQITVDNQRHSVMDFTSFMMLSYRIKKQFSVGLMQMNHMARKVTADGYTMSSRRHSDLFLAFVRGTFLKDRLSVSLSFVPYVPQIPWLDYEAVTYQQTPTGEHTQVTEILPSRNVFSLRASFLFNKGKVRKRKGAEENAEQEMMF